MQLDTIFGMGERQRIMANRRRTRLYGLVVAAGVILFGALMFGINILTSDEPVERVATPASAPDPDEMARAAQAEAAFMAGARQTTAEAEKEIEKPAPQASKPAPQLKVPSDTTMYLTIPKMGLQDIPVVEGVSEAELSQGAGHLPGTGFPWVEGSNTYIAGHRLGYPGTLSDHVFWDLPSLVAGDEVILEDSLGQTYTYQVTNIVEVSPNDLSVTGSTGSDVVSLQTCIENYGDYWTAGPNWFVRYVVQAERVS